MKWEVTYYERRVAEAITKWPIKLRAKYLRIIEIIEENGPQIGNPITESMGDGLFEIRIKAKEGIGRAFFCYAAVVKNEIVILHAFIKKTQKTPKKELSIARQRLKELR